MTASKKFMNAASAIALSVVLAAPMTFVVSMGSATYAEAAVVNRIEVRGNKRVDANTIRNNIGIKPGANFSNADVDNALKHLFGMGVFSNATIRQSGNSLIVTVSEYEVVNNVIFQGNKRIKDPELERVIQLQPRAAFDPALLEADAQTIRDAYSYVGRNDVTVNARTIDLGQGRVNVVFQIVEGERTKIDDISFEGNNAFGDRRLRDVIATKRSGILSWLTRGDVYSPDRLAADEEALRRFYYNQGYADFYVVSSNAVLDEATNKYKINFVVEEGQKYRLGDVRVESTVSGIDTENMRNVIKTDSGDVYSARKIEDSVLAINNRVASAGYAFAQVEPRGDRNFEDHTISIVYSIDEGPRAYVERIEIRGNDKTRDYVIRREFDLSEGDAFNQTMVQRAKRRLESLGFFESVNVSTAPGAEPDQVVLIVDVVERATGEFSIGGGYTTGGDSPGASVEASITERNFLGRGQYIRIGAGAGQDDARNYEFSFTEPYFLGYRVAAGFDVFRRTYRMNDDFDVEQTGGSVRLAAPITTALTASIAYNYVQEEYDLDGPSGTLQNDAYRQYIYNRYSGAIVQAADKSPWTRSSVSLGLTYNTVDNLQNPHDGLFARLTNEYAGVGGDANFYKVSARASLYKTISDEYDLVGLLTVGGGHMEEIGSDGVRIFDMFKSNNDIIRGFKYNGIGPMQRSGNYDRYFLGGTTYFHGTAEVQFPMPLVPDSLGMRAAIFADAATLYGNNYEPDYAMGETAIIGDESAWRASSGISLMWASPFGPLRFDYAWPIKKEAHDREQNFSFGMSSKF